MRKEFDHNFEHTHNQEGTGVIRRTRAQRLKLNNKSDLSSTSAQKRASGYALNLSPKVKELKRISRENSARSSLSMSRCLSARSVKSPQKQEAATTLFKLDSPFKHLTKKIGSERYRLDSPSQDDLELYGDTSINYYHH